LGSAKNLSILLGVVLALVLVFFFMRQPYTHKVIIPEGVRGSVPEKVVAPVEKPVDNNTNKPYYSDVTSSRIASFTAPKKLEPVYEMLRAGEYEKSVDEIAKLEKSQTLTPEEKQVLDFTKAQVYFTTKNFTAARKLFEAFLKENPTHPLAENAQRSIEFMDNYEKFKKDYKSFEDEIKKR